MGWIEMECRTPNGEQVLGMDVINDDLYVYTASQMYKAVMEDEKMRLLPIHQFMQPGHA